MTKVLAFKASLSSMSTHAKGVLSFLSKRRMNTMRNAQEPSGLWGCSPKALTSSKTFLGYHLLCIKNTHEFHILLHKIFMLV